MEAFTPSPGSTVNIDVSSSSQSVALGVGGETQVRVYNDGTATAWINHGPTGVTAALASGMPVGPGVCEVITIAGYGSTAYFAAIAAASTGKIYFTPGVGI
jgi:hypothetical protein